MPALYNVSMYWREDILRIWGGMQRDNRSSGQGASGAASAPARDRAAVERRLAQAGTPDQCCVELSRIFGVRPNEVALLRLENGLLKFL